MKVAPVPRAAKLHCGGVRHAPIQIKQVGEARVRYELIERSGALGDGASWLQQNGHATVPCHTLQDTCGQQLCNDRAMLAHYR